MAVAAERKSVPLPRRSALATRFKAVAVAWLKRAAVTFAVFAAALLWSLVLTAVSIVAYTAYTVWVYGRVTPAVSGDVVRVIRQRLSETELRGRSAGGMKWAEQRLAWIRRPGVGVYLGGVVGAIALGLLVGRLA